MGLDFNVDEMNPENVGKATSGENVVPGKYLAQLAGVKDHVAQNGTRGIEMTYEIIGGKFDGKNVKEVLWSVADGDDDKKKTTKQNQQASRAQAVGLLKVTEGKYVYASDAKGEKMSVFQDVLNARCVIDVVNEKWENKDKGTAGVSDKVKFFSGVIHVDNPLVKSIVAGGPPILEGPPKAKKPQVDAGDL